MNYQVFSQYEGFLPVGMNYGVYLKNTKTKIINIFLIYFIINIHISGCQSFVTVAATVFL